MFKFLKEKLKDAVNVFSKKAEEEAIEEPPEKISKEQKQKEKKSTQKIKKEELIKPKKEYKKKEDKEEPKQEKAEDKKEAEKKKEEKKEEIEKKDLGKDKEKKKGFFQGIFHKKEDIKEESQEHIEKEEGVGHSKEEKKEEITEKPLDTEKDKKGFFQRVGETFTKISLSEDKFDELFWDFEVAMLENNVALEVIEKIKYDLKEKLTKDKLQKGKLNSIIISSLRDSISALFDVEKIDLINEIKLNKKPFVIIFVGVNGSGKTTNMVKFANLCLKNNLKPVIAACDTFRAAAIQQLEIHAKKLDVKLIKHGYGSDAAAVAYDAIQHAKAKNHDVVLIDTAGRSDANINLMDELKKVMRISNPDFVVFVGDSLTGNDAVDQAKAFNDAVGIDGIILSKTDVDEKGGAFMSVSYITKKPILYVGTGQSYSDIKEFDSNIVIEGLSL